MRNLSLSLSRASVDTVFYSSDISCCCLYLCKFNSIHKSAKRSSCYSSYFLHLLFITFFAEGPLLYDAIVKEQLFVLRSSRLYDAPLTNLYYDVVIGRNSSAYPISPDKKFLKLAWLPNGTEVETLQSSVSKNMSAIMRSYWFVCACNDTH